MVVDSTRPHFVGVDPDILSTGLVFYYLKVSDHNQIKVQLLATTCMTTHSLIVGTDIINIFMCFIGWIYINRTS